VAVSKTFCLYISVLTVHRPHTQVQNVSRSQLHIASYLFIIVTGILLFSFLLCFFVFLFLFYFYVCIVSLNV